MLILDSIFKFYVDGITGVAAANTTTAFDYRIASPLCIYGFALIQQGASFGDYISLQIIDKDNILGYGANFIVSTIITKGYADPNTTRIVDKSEYARTIPIGLYVRINYTNTALITSVNVAANFFFVIPPS